MYDIGKYTWRNPDNSSQNFVETLTKKFLNTKILPDDETLISYGVLYKSSDGKIWHILQKPIKNEEIDNFNQHLEKWFPLISGLPINRFDGVILNQMIIASCKASKSRDDKIIYLNECQIIGKISRNVIERADRCHFYGEISILNERNVSTLEFNYCTFEKNIFYQGVEFSITVQFNLCIFKSEFEINECILVQKLYFINNNFIGEKCSILISRSKFYQDFYIEAYQSEINKINIENCEFLGVFNLSATNPALIDQSCIKISQSTFEKSISVDFGKALLPSVFNNCHLKGPLKIRKPNFINRRSDLIPNLKQNDYEDTVDLWERTEKGAQELRAIASSKNDKLTEWAYYDIEHYAKLQIAKLEKRFVPFDYLYEVCSGNGLSLTKPLKWLLYLWIVPSIIYLATQAYSLSQQGEVVFSPKAVFNGLIVSGSQMVLGSFKGDNKWIEFITCMEEHSFYLSVFDRVIAFSQNLFSIVLVFLFGLAIRRRYQV